MPAPTKFDRVEAALAGESVDRVPVSLWGHNYQKEWSARDLAEAMLDQHRRYDWDFLKVNPRACYMVEDWGARYVPSGNESKPYTLVQTPVREPRDLENLDLLRFDRGALEEQLQALRLIGRELGREAPFIQTIFCPIAILGYLVGDDAKLIEWLDSDPKHVKTGLEAVTETYRAYAGECLNAGAIGIFFATTNWATRDTLTEDQYREFAVPYDRRVLEAVGDAWFNVLHVCRANNLFDLFLDYPVQAVNWASREPGNPSLDEGRELLKDRVAVMGGLSQTRTLPDGSPADIEREVRDAIERTEKHHFLLTGECSIPPRTPDANRAAVAATARRL